MEKAANSYESLFIVNPTLGEDEIKATVAKFTGLISENGTIVSVSEWGKRKLAYPINDIREGYYVLVYFTAAGSFPSELERKFNIDETIMRSLVVMLDGKKAKIPEAAPVAPAVVSFDEDDEPSPRRRGGPRRPYAERNDAPAPAAEAAPEAAVEATSEPAAEVAAEPAVTETKTEE